MIFPILRGLISPFRAPMTFLLFALNLAVFVVTLESFDRVDRDMDAILTDSRFLETQGSAFAIMIDREGELFSNMLAQLARRALDGDHDSKKILGSLAVRNVTFMNRAQIYSFSGDEIALEKWRVKFIELKGLQNRHPSYLWGISRLNEGWVQFITYQFAHSGMLHLLWNMIFLVVFGAFIEVTLGGSFVVLTYLGAGLFGAWIFSRASGISSAPLVGASAAVSGLMALVGFAWIRRHRLRFFYWLLPVEGYFGIVMLPSWLVLVVSLLPDLSGYLSASRDFGSVAYSAHLGGAAWGAIMAGLFATGVLKKDDPPTAEPKPDDFRQAG